MTAFFGLLLIVLYLFLKDTDSKNKMRKKYKAMVERGEFIKTNPQRFREILLDFNMDWHKTRSLVPKEYIRYFEINNQAKNDYFLARAQEQEIKEGYKPYLVVGSYDKNTYDPYRHFNAVYKNKIAQYNETGKIYI